MSTADYSTLQGLVERYSPTGQEAEAVSWLVDRMMALECDRAFKDAAGNAVGIWGDGPRQVVLLGHIDTVAGQIPVRIEEGSLYGRGSVDAKGSLSAFVDAVASIGRLPGWQWVVVGAVAEEGDSAGARFASGQYQPGFTVIGEPSGWDRVTMGYKGSATTEITLRRTVAHPASPIESACEAAFIAWGAVQRWSDKINTGHERVFEQVSPTLRGFSSGGDGLAEWARLCIGVRLPLGFSPQDWHQALSQLISGSEIASTSFAIPAYRGEKNTPLVRAFLAGIRAAGGSPGFLLKTGTADMNIVAPAWGCPAVAYGPGDSSLDHTPNEHLSITEYLQSVHVIESVLERLSKYEEG